MCAGSLRYVSKARCLPATPARTAAEQAALQTPMLGCFSFGSKGSTCLAHVFAMRVVEELESWPENYRSRRWVSFPTALYDLQPVHWAQRRVSVMGCILLVCTAGDLCVLLLTQLVDFADGFLSAICFTLTCI